jgi:hypothetical protein
MFILLEKFSYFARSYTVIKVVFAFEFDWFGWFLIKVLDEIKKIIEQEYIVWLNFLFYIDFFEYLSVFAISTI